MTGNLFERIKDIYNKVTAALQEYTDKKGQMNLLERMDNEAKELAEILRDVEATGSYTYVSDGVKMKETAEILERGYNDLRNNLMGKSDLCFTTKTVLNGMIEETFMQAIYTGIAILDNFYISVNGVDISEDVAAEQEA